MENDAATTSAPPEVVPSVFQLANQAMTTARDAKLQGALVAGQGQQYEDWVQEHCKNAVSTSQDQHSSAEPSFQNQFINLFEDAVADDDDFDTDNVDVAVELNVWFLARQAHQAAEERRVQQELEQEVQRLQAAQEAARLAAEAQQAQEARAAEEAKARRQAAREKNLQARSVVAKTEDLKASPDAPLGPGGDGQVGDKAKDSEVQDVDDEVQEVPPVDLGTTDAEGEDESKAGGDDTAGRALSSTVAPGWNPGQRMYLVSEPPQKTRPKPMRKPAKRVAGRTGGSHGGKHRVCWYEAR
jgi:hypothetical protein